MHAQSTPDCKLKKIIQSWQISSPDPHNCAGPPDDGQREEEKGDGYKGGNGSLVEDPHLREEQ